MALFQLGEKPEGTRGLLLGIAGAIFVLAIWWFAAEQFSEQRPMVTLNTRLDGFEGNRDSLLRADSIALAQNKQFEKIYPIFPPPHRVVTAFAPLLEKDNLLGETWYSLWLNLKGYLWAVLIAVPLGFLVGLFPVARGMFNNQLNALRYLPLSALTGLFIIWFGIGDEMKIAFLTFGILVYLLPVVVQRIDETESVYQTMAFTLGASDWQTIRSVFLPAVFSRLIDDIRVLTAISWTYIIIAELLNRTRGIGSLIFLKGKQGQVDRVFACLLVIIIVGFLQDQIFVYIDKRLNPHKYYKTNADGLAETRYGIWAILGIMFLTVLQEIFFPAFGATFLNLVAIGVLASLVIIGFGEQKLMKAR